jgi:hypothetical protein
MESANRLQGEVQLAAAVLVVGNKIVDFPEQQCERVVHAYIGQYQLRTVDSDTQELISP